jgi:hypothetical protein
MKYFVQNERNSLNVQVAPIGVHRQYGVLASTEKNHLESFILNNNIFELVPIFFITFTFLKSNVK